MTKRKPEHTIILKLDPGELDNPDLDIRYELPDLLAERSGGIIQDDGYDYAEQRPGAPGGPPLLLFLKASDLGPALRTVREVIDNVRVLGNDLRPGVTVGVQRAGTDAIKVVYPEGAVWEG